MLKWKIIFAVSLQILCAYIAGGLSFWYWFALTYCVGGTINHSLTLGMHEVSHNMAFHSFQFNRYFGMFTNIPLGIPSFV
jgi:sphingolipid 4-desaturase/C4-monooxygenase